MKTDIELRQLRYFVAVAEELNFTRAAERLKIAQPPLSRQIRSLEKMLAVQLLERTNRRVSLTAAGKVFLAECYQILDQVESTVRETQRLARGETGQLTMAFESALGQDLVPLIVSGFQQHFPDVELILHEMSSGQQLTALHEQDIDLGLIEPIIVTPTDEVDLLPLRTEPLMVVLAQNHALAKRKELALHQLTEEAWVTGYGDRKCGLLLRILAACDQAGFSPNIQQQANDLQMLLNLIRSGLGITLLPASIFKSSRPGIKAVPLAQTDVNVEFAIAWRANHQSLMLQAFLDVIQAVMGERQG